MSYKLGQRSLERLEGVDERMVAVVKSAIHRTKVDFGVVCGLRTIEEQRELVAKGASQTMKSKHLDGVAVDLMAYVGSRASWELNLYDDIADAMREAAKDLGIAICWGAAWSTIDHPYPLDICAWEGTMEEAMKAYVKKKSDAGKRAFIDGPHFELIV
jgi:peptidoglycan L-alanyl-D-glutamate endopeptidase CwlK